MAGEQSQFGLEEGERLYAGIGEMHVAHNPSSLIIMGLGSCIALALYDKVSKVGGIAHVMLPDSRGDCDAKKCCKYADRAIPILLKEMARCDAKKEHIVAKIAGGASIFSSMDSLQIGEKNKEVVKKALKTEKIRLVAEDTGGRLGRTVTLDTRTGDFSVKTKDEVKII